MTITKYNHFHTAVKIFTKLNLAIFKDLVWLWWNIQSFNISIKPWMCSVLYIQTYICDMWGLREVH